MDKKIIEVDTKTFVRFWLVILGLGLLGLFIWKAMTGLIIIGIALFLAIAIQPLAARIQHLTKGSKHPSLAPVIAYIFVIVALGIILSVIAPVVVNETVRFVRQLPDTFQHSFGGWDGINSFGQSLGIDNLQGEILSGIQSFSNTFVTNLGDVVAVSIGTISQITTGVILTLVLTLFFVIEGPDLLRSFWSFLEGHGAGKGKPKSASIRALQHLAERISGVISTYISKQVTVAFLDGCVVTAAVLLLSFTCGFSSSLALPMGLIALVFYLIPMFGPIISCTLISLLLFFSSPLAAFIFLIFYIIYAQIENNFIAPKLQGDAQGLPTALILTAIIIGMYMFGLIGAIIAIPIAGCAKVLIEELPNIRTAKQQDLAASSKES